MIWMLAVIAIGLAIVIYQMGEIKNTLMALGIVLTEGLLSDSKVEEIVQKLEDENKNED